MKVAKKLLLLTVASGLLLSSADADARRRRSSSGSLNCRTQPQECQNEITKLKRQVKGLAAALKKARGGAPEDVEEVDVNDSDDSAVSPELSREIQSIRARVENMLKIAEGGFNKGNKARFNKFLGRALDRARKAFAQVERGTEEHKEMQSIIARLSNVKGLMDNLKGRVSKKQLKETTAKVVDYLKRIDDRAAGVGSSGGDDDLVDL